MLGVSPDDVKSHGKFAAKYGLEFTLLADLGAKVCNDYGVWKLKSMFGRTYMGVERTTFVIDRDGVVRKVFPKVKVNGHAGAVLDAIKAAAGSAMRTLRIRRRRLRGRGRHGTRRGAARACGGPCTSRR